MQALSQKETPNRRFTSSKPGRPRRRHLGRADHQIAEHHRHRASDHRGAAEYLVAAAEYFDADDQALIEHIYDRGCRVVEVARLRNETARDVRRRLHRLARRANQPLFRYVVACYKLIPSDIRTSADLIVLKGHTMAEAARLQNISHYHVRRHIQILRALSRVG